MLRCLLARHRGAGPAAVLRRHVLWCCVPVAFLGCATLSEMVGESEPFIPDGAKIEGVVVTDGSWRTMAVNKPMGNPMARSDVPQRWASPRYGTRDWAAAAVGDVSEGPTADFNGAKWIWYPYDGFQFGATNSMPHNARVVHLRREFYIDRRASSIGSAHVSVMSSGNVSFNVYVNGYIVRLARTLDRPVLGQRQWNTDERDAIPDLSPRRFDIKPFLVYGKNAIGIVATTHVEDVGGEGVPRARRHRHHGRILHRIASPRHGEIALVRARDHGEAAVRRTAVEHREHDLRQRRDHLPVAAVVLAL